MSTHNGPEDPIPSPAEVIALVAEVLNEKNLSAIEGIAADDYVELDPFPG